MRTPDWSRLAEVFVAIGLRMTTETKGDDDADGGVLPGVDRRASSGRVPIDGQAEKLRAYALLHDLGEVTVLADPGLSGKDLHRPGLQQLLAMIEAGHVSAVLIWRLDRLSRNLVDLILLAERFEKRGVALHSFTEQLDLTSATGRMFFNILGSFAQYYRESLAENVRMGMSQAIRQGRYVNRPPTGYDLHDGLLVPNADAPMIRKAFAMRAQGASQGDIATATNLAYSTVLQVLKNRHYLGEIKHKEQWFPGPHEPLVASEVFDAAHRGRVPGRKRGRDLMSGRVVCGMCGRRMSVEENGKGQRHYRCKHRGKGCTQPARSNKGLLNAFALATQLLCDVELREAIRRHLEERRQSDGVRRRRTTEPAKRQIERLRNERRKLLQLHYDGHISGDQFGEEQGRITLLLESLEAEATEAATRTAEADDLAMRFDQVAALLDSLDFDTLWAHATEAERRTLLDELLNQVTVQPDRLVVEIHGAPPLNVAFSEVGLKDSNFRGVGGGT
jgi:DNA invertase Pin-like site-specific DNA recombinase